MTDIVLGFREGRLTMHSIVPQFDVILVAAIGMAGSLIAVVAEEGRGMVATAGIVTAIAAPLAVFANGVVNAKKIVTDHRAALAQIDAQQKTSHMKIQADLELARIKIQAEQAAAALRIQAEQAQAVELAKWERHDLSNKLQSAIFELTATKHRINEQDVALAHHRRTIEALTQHSPKDPPVPPMEPEPCPPPGPDYTS